MNNSFETGENWRFGDTKIRGAYTTAITHSGLRSVRLGNDDYSRPNKLSYSSISQTVYLHKPGKTNAYLGFWYFPLSDLEPGDQQEVILLDAHTGRTLKVLWRVNQNDQQWLYQRIDVTRYLGRSIIVYFNVFNNGGVGRTAMYLDDVSLMACGPMPAPVATTQSAQPASPSQPMQTIQPTQSAPSSAPIQTVPPSQPAQTEQSPLIALSPPPTTLFISPVASATTTVTPALESNLVPVTVLPLVTTTPAYQQTLPTTPPKSPTLWQTALNALWYLLIFFIVILIIVIALLMIRLVWGQMSKNEEDDVINAAMVVEQSADQPTTQVTPPEEAPADMQENGAPEPPPPPPQENS